MQNAFQWPEEVRFWRRFSKESSLAFLSALAWGFFTHLYSMTNLLLNLDAVGNTFSWNRHIPSGRWALGTFSALSSIEQMPIVISCIAILMLALTAVITVRALQISSPVCIVLTSALVVSFPSVAGTFTFLYTSDAYFIGLFFAALAVYLVKDSQSKWGG